MELPTSGTVNLRANLADYPELFDDTTAQLGA